MKFTKLLPIAFALALLCPASNAAVTQSESANAEFSVTINPYIYISRTSSDDGLTTTVKEIGTNYSSLTLTDAMNATFHVATNKTTDTVYLSAKDGKNTNKALFPSNDGSSIVLVFTNSGKTVEQAAITSAGALGAGAENANAIGFPLDSITCAPDGNANHGGSITSTTGASNKITYVLTNGEYDFEYVLPTEISENPSFTTLDENGTYKAYLYLTHTTP